MSAENPAATSNVLPIKHTLIQQVAVPMSFLAVGVLAGYLLGRFRKKGVQAA